MTFNEYQKEADKTAIYPNRGHNLVYVTLGLAGEAGEVAEKVKKLIRDKGGVADDAYKKEIAKELGDVIWYLAEISTELGFEFEDVAQMNLEKLKSRMDREKLRGDGDNR
ncbi:MAG: nucleoside triphosphate pyrophosphohydrolase family protein [Candidatus Liptonbacteria bacterium]|nr:nucleoside triphosphate pyrophosphohydrolase family protein [Candidatus Liptonbacteria bacterium]